LINESIQLQIVRLFYEENKSVRKIAQELGCHRNTVRNYIERYEKHERNYSENWIVRPKSKGRWEELLKEAQLRVEQRKKDKKISVMDLYMEIRGNYQRYQSFGLSVDENFSYSSFYLAWRNSNKGLSIY
jgi:transposase